MYISLQVMCNCAAQVDTYNAFNSAVADCSAYNGAGAGSCVANVLGHVSLKNKQTNKVVDIQMHK